MVLCYDLLVHAALLRDGAGAFQIMILELVHDERLLRGLKKLYINEDRRLGRRYHDPERSRVWLEVNMGHHADQTCIAQCVLHGGQLTSQAVWCTFQRIRAKMRL